MDKAFRHAGNIYEVQHNNDTDGRGIVDREGNHVLTIDKDLMITDQGGQFVGRIISVGTTWNLRRPNMEDVSVGDLRGYDWRALLDAEIEAAKLLIDAALPT